MRNIIEKIIIAILSTYGFYIANSDINPVPYLLIIIAISITLDLVKNDNHKKIIYLIFFSLIIYNNLFLYFVPIIFYNAIIDFKNITLLALLLLYNFTSILTIFISVLSIYLSYKKNEFEYIQIENKKVRDNLKEDTISLKSYNKQLIREYEKDIEIAILKERNRISKELHDSVGHLVSSSILQVEALSLITDDSNENVLNGLDKLQGRLTNGMKEIRESIHNLHSESLDLENQILNTISEYPNLDIDINYSINDDYSYGFKFDILTIIRETIVNTSKHSNGNKMRINILEQPKFISISIKDNGILENKNIDKSGIGLITIEEIAEKYNGFVNYNLENGFNIHITLMKGK